MERIVFKTDAVGRLQAAREIYFRVDGYLLGIVLNNRLADPEVVRQLGILAANGPCPPERRWRPDD